MDKKKVEELIQEVVRNNVDSLEFGNDKHNAPLRKANSLLHDALIELGKSDWVSVEDGLPPYEDDVLVCNEKEPSDMWFGHRTSDRRVIVDEHEFAKGYETITHWRKIDELED